MRRYSIEAPHHREPSARTRGPKNNHSRNDSPPVARVLSESEKEAALARFFVPFNEVMPKWEQRLKDMNLSRLNFPLMCRKLTDAERKILDMDEIKTWFFNRSEMDSSFRRIERKKADVFDALLTRVEECIKAGETFAVESGAKPYVPKTKAVEVPNVIIMTPALRLKLRDIFELGQITPREVHHYMDEVGLNNGPSLIAVNRWFSDKDVRKGVEKQLFANFLAAALALMETKLSPSEAQAPQVFTGRTDPSDCRPELHPVQ